MSIITYLFEALWITLEISRKRFLLYREAMGQCDPSAFLDITFQSNKNEKVFASKIYMEKTCVTLEKAKKYIYLFNFLFIHCTRFKTRNG